MFVVLVAHNGSKFDFPILLAEMERRPEKLAVSQLKQLQVHFADTLVYLKQVNSVSPSISKPLPANN